MIEQQVADLDSAPDDHDESASSRPPRRGLRRIYHLATVHVVRSNSGMTVISLILVLALWWAASWLSGLPTYVLPSPPEVAEQFFRFPSILLQGTLSTAIEVLIGFAIAVAIGVPLAIMIAFSRVVERLLYPITVGAQAVPKVAVAPIFLVWFGFGTMPKILIAALIAFFPVVIDTVVGLRSIDPDMVHMAKVTGAGRLRIFRKVRIPVALPSVFSGLKVAITLAVTGAVVGEFVAGTSGLGYLIQNAQGNQQTALAFAAIILLALLSLVFFYLVEAAEHIFIKG